MLTTYKQNTVDIGKMAAEKLIDLIEKPKSTITGQYTVKGYLIEGKTVSDI